jgi:hypothetical protein
MTFDSWFMQSDAFVCSFFEEKGEIPFSAAERRGKSRTQSIGL